MSNESGYFTDRNAIDHVIYNTEICRLGLSDGEIPYIVPVCFGYDGVNVYFHSAPQGKKMRILAKNPNICLEFALDSVLSPAEQVCEWTYKYTTVIGSGKAHLLQEHTHIKYGLAQIIQHYKRFTPSKHEGHNHIPELPSEALDATAVYKVTFTELTGKSNLG